jgi:hypothetical protein
MLNDGKGFTKANANAKPTKRPSIHKKSSGENSAAVRCF